MKYEARLSTGEFVVISDPYFVDMLSKGGHWPLYGSVDATLSGSDAVIRVNPAFIVWIHRLGDSG